MAGKLRREDQGEEPGGERHAGTVMTKVQLAQVREAKINGDQRNRKRGEKFQHAGR